MFISRIPSKGKKGQSYQSILLRESYRQGSKVKSRTLAVLTKLPAHLIGLIRQAIQQPDTPCLESFADRKNGPLQLRTAESFGALWVLAQMTERLGINQALGVTRQAELALWQVVARVLRPGISLLGMVRLAGTCAAAAILRWTQPFTEDHLYGNGTWLEGRHALVEKRLWVQGSKNLSQLYLYDVTSSYLEGEHNALGHWGYNRDGKKGKQQVVVGMLTDAQGDPCAVKVYEGNTSDLKTFADQVHKLRQSFGCQGVTIVGDRGMIRSPQMAQAQALGFHYLYLGRDKKLPAFETLKRETGLHSENFCFIGDDLPDIPVMKEVGLGIAVRNATELTQQNSDYITRKGGGEGAVREVVEIILHAQNLLEDAIQNIWKT